MFQSISPLLQLAISRFFSPGNYVIYFLPQFHKESPSRIHQRLLKWRSIFHKLIYGFPSSEVNNSQTSLLIRGIQRSQPSSPDSRQPKTLDILTKCIRNLRTGYQSIHTARTLDAMFLLAFFGFLRCSEIAITSKFNPKLHPTISDLSIIDSETIAYFIKQSKTDQKGKATPYKFSTSHLQSNPIRLSFLISKSGTPKLNPHWTLSSSTILTTP